MTQPADVSAEVQKAIAELEAQFLAEMPRYRWTADQVIAENDVTRLKGKNVIVTGATSGIGIPTALAFAKTGCHLTVTTRDAAKAAAVEAQYRSVAEAAGGSVTFVSLDLTSFSSARQFVAAWGAKPIDLLVHNAGVMASPFTLTPDGEELQMQTNFLSLVVITEGLRAFLAEKARVVILSSRAHRFVMDADFLPLFRYYLTTVKSDASKYEKWACYGVTKSLEVMYAKVLSEEFEAENRSVRAVAVHPGGIATNLLQYLSPEETTRMQLSVLPGRTNPLQKTPEQGAATTVWAAVSPDLEGVGGVYCENCTVTPPDFCSPGGFSWNTPDAKLMRGVAPHVSKPDVYRTAVAETRAYLASKALL